MLTPRDVVGIDLGLTSAAVIHDGEIARAVEPQRPLRRNLAKLRRLDRQLLEDLHVRGMQRNRHLAYKSEWYGSTLVIADRFYPSSKLCSGCGVIKDALGLSERVYECDVCGLRLDRDETPVERKALAPAPASVKPASLKQEATADGSSRSTRRSTPKDVLVRV